MFPAAIAGEHYNLASTASAFLLPKNYIVAGGIGGGLTFNFWTKEGGGADYDWKINGIGAILGGGAGKAGGKVGGYFGSFSHKLLEDSGSAIINGFKSIFGVFTTSTTLTLDNLIDNQDYEIKREK